MKRPSKGKSKAQNQEFDIPVCMIIDGSHEPLLPSVPGEHGTQISAFLQSLEDELATEENLTHIPLFIKCGDGGFKYYGTYREPRYSDRLGANEMLDLPYYVKRHWAKKIGAGHKPRWAIHAIQEAWPKTLIGWVDEGVKAIIPYSPNLEVELGEPMKSNISDLEAEEVTAEDILQSFENVGSLFIHLSQVLDLHTNHFQPDMGDKPAMRLYYEYLQCDGYDRAFYEALIAKKHGH
jgi:hypothetical protein